MPSARAWAGYCKPRIGADVGDGDDLAGQDLAGQRILRQDQIAFLDVRVAQAVRRGHPQFRPGFVEQADRAGPDVHGVGGPLDDTVQHLLELERRVDRLGAVIERLKAIVGEEEVLAQIDDFLLAPAQAVVDGGGEVGGDEHRADEEEGHARDINGSSVKSDARDQRDVRQPAEVFQPDGRSRPAGSPRRRTGTWPLGESRIAAMMMWKKK